jgi:hypothetical protein
MGINGHHSLCFLTVNGADRGAVEVVDQVTNLNISVHAFPDPSVKWEIQNDSLRCYYSTEAGMTQQTAQLLHSLIHVYNSQIHVWHLRYFEQFCNKNTDTAIKCLYWSADDQNLNGGCIRADIFKRHLTFRASHCMSHIGTHVRRQTVKIIHLLEVSFMPERHSDDNCTKWLTAKRQFTVL